MGKPIKNDFFSGNNGEVWVDGKKVLTCHKASIVENIEYEEIPDPANPGNTQRIEVGRNYDVNILFRPTGEEEFNAFLTSDDISVISVYRAFEVVQLCFFLYFSRAFFISSNSCSLYL